MKYYSDQIELLGHDPKLDINKQKIRNLLIIKLDSILERGRKRLKFDVYKYQIINGDKASPNFFRKFRDPIAYSGVQGGGH